MTDLGGKGIGLWDERAGFFYDAARLLGGQAGQEQESLPEQGAHVQRGGPRYRQVSRG